VHSHLGQGGWSGKGAQGWRLQLEGGQPLRAACRQRGPEAAARGWLPPPRGPPQPPPLADVQPPPRPPAGTALLCYVTPKEHLGLPDREDVKQVGGRGSVLVCVCHRGASGAVSRGRNGVCTCYGV
jgi:hypothetical protein